MNHGYWGGDWSGGAFWLFIAACVVVGSWEKIRRNAEKHETLRRVMEKTGTLDEARLKELFDPSGPDWMKSVPGEAYRGLRIAGTIVLCIAVAVAVFFLILGQTGVIPRPALIIGLSAAAAVSIIGVGLFISSRFTDPPPDGRNGPPAR
jgi:hypothetical protein